MTAFCCKFMSGHGSAKTITIG